MKNTEQKPALTAARVMECMTPGTSYSGRQLSRLVGYNQPEVQTVLSACVARGIVRQTRDGGRSIYRVPTEEEIRHERERLERRAFPPGELQGYDAVMRRFREMCMATRVPLSGSANGKGNSEPHE
ncbi:hypothetical protein R75461_07226 [Paraburkholderia nemoris]|uniref:hypothetical protein n=1 Tax=Paraburkholderia nemoris TaxID=2793076 RepID=UPI00190E0E65|nr:MULTISPECIES: hypothetical protein [Paraburkholderia]MBK3787083.1 hypothetical protein [Paraburkholderia aspalathi]CAE6845378.1 hypothetical protein R75461_07226 [Paraburkholderia nemoris]